MLHLLHIENIAVIEKADIAFAPGFNVLTGETGAGKSIVIDALTAVTGSRTSKDIIRTGAHSALVTASFTSDEARGWCKENAIEVEDDDQLFLMRSIASDGKNQCRVNGVPISVAQLRELGSLLLDVHGQNDGRRLLDEASHLQYLDSFGGLDGLKEEYRLKYREYRDLCAQLESLNMDESEKERRIDNLKYQIDELERADIRVGELDEKKERREILKNASKLIGAVDAAYYAVYGGDESEGVLSLLDEAEGSVSFASRYAENMKDLSEKLTEMKYASQYVAEELRNFRESLDFSPQELDELDERLDQLHRLAKKYGPTEEGMLSYLEQCRRELNDIEFSSEKKIKLEQESESSRKAALKLAEELSEKRRAAAEKLRGRIMEELSQLNMPGVIFEVWFGKVESGSGMNQSGCDEVRFLMSANAGEAPGRISRIASGGELSRIMLAMKNVLSENDNVETIVFDEIDTGVSGIAAQRVGEKICDLAFTKQVLCVTHLPQIAAMADVHFAIEKETDGERTFTSVTPLDYDGRKQEIARLTGGENVTVTTLSSAAEQLVAAEKYKSEKR